MPEERSTPQRVPAHIDAAALRERLRILALDLRWAWCHDADTLWERVEPNLWSATRNPWLTLLAAGDDTLQVLASDPLFREGLEAVEGLHAQAAAQPPWFARQNAAAFRGVAYFSLEFGLSEAVPIYAGGLGILAGDHLKTASDLGVPVTGVGLLYRHGYFRQIIDASGAQRELYPPNDPGLLPIEPVHDANGALVRVPLDLPGRTIHLRAWLARVGRARLYLLDANDPSNAPADRAITSTLYADDPETRLQQELSLGIGGWRLLHDTLGVPIDVCHLNEGHAAFATLARAGSIANELRVPFEHAMFIARVGNVFTTHTPVDAAFDRFGRALVRAHIEPHAAAWATPADELLALGTLSGSRSSSEDFLPAYLALRTCGFVNGVSRRHGAVSRALFAPLFPRVPIAEVPVAHVTNGVHVASWDSIEADAAWTQACGPDRWRSPGAAVAEQIASIDDGTLMDIRAHARRRLVDAVRERLVHRLASAGASTERLDAARATLDPTILTLGFARRFTAYKRPTLLLDDPERLVRLLQSHDRPVQLVVAGKAHPDDGEGKAAIAMWTRFAERLDVRSRVAFIDDYDLLVAEAFVQGVDVWLNMPTIPLEACGTSGMKVLVNGGLNASVLDGWWVEAFTPDVGWAIGAEGGGSAVELYDLLEQQIVPTYYGDADPPGPAWLRYVRTSMSRLTPVYSSVRMLAEYVSDSYRPAAAAYTMRHDQAAAAQQVPQSVTDLRDAWPTLRFTSFDVARSDDHTSFRIGVDFGGVDPHHVNVEMYADPLSAEAPPERWPATRGDDGVFVASIPGHRDAGDFTARIVPNIAGLRLPIELPLVHWFGS